MAVLLGEPHSIDNGDAIKSLITVRGHTGLGIEPRTDAFESNPSWIEFVEDDMSIVLESPACAVPDLERVAESMA